MTFRTPTMPPRQRGQINVVSEEGRYRSRMASATIEIAQSAPLPFRSAKWWPMLWIGWCRSFLFGGRSHPVSSHQKSHERRPRTAFTSSPAAWKIAIFGLMQNGGNIVSEPRFRGTKQTFGKCPARAWTYRAVRRNAFCRASPVDVGRVSVSSAIFRE